jgi:hypothetical protein
VNRNDIAQPANRIIRLVRIARPAPPRPQPPAQVEAVALNCDPYNRMGRDCAELIYKRFR